MFERYIERLKNIRDDVELTAVLDELTVSAGFSQYRLALVLQTPHIVRPKAVIYSNCSTAWIERYTSERMASKDPIIFLAMNQVLPIVWEKLPSFSTLPAGADLVMSEAKKFGLQNGISFPMRGPRGELGVYSFITDDPDANVEKLAPHLGHVVNYALDAVLRILSKRNHQVLKPLTERELICLLWAAEGKTSGEIAIILGLNERTVRFRLDEVIQKLGASNRAHAVVIASMAGMIYPEMRAVEIEDKISPNAPDED